MKSTSSIGAPVAASKVLGFGRGFSTAAGRVLEANAPHNRPTNLYECAVLAADVAKHAEQYNEFMLQYANCRFQGYGNCDAYYTFALDELHDFQDAVATWNQYCAL